MGRKPKRANSSGETQAFKPKTIHYDELPQTIKDKFAKPKIDGSDKPIQNFKDKDGVIPLLVKKGCSPLFIETLLKPRVKEDHSLDELESENRHWPLLPGSYETGKHR